MLQDVIDVREDGQSVDETEYETCMMCNNERIRYVHIVSHSDVEEEFKVGCVCAEKMTNDYVTPKRLEKKLRQRTARRINWVKKPWKQTENGNHTFVFEEHRLLILKTKRPTNSNAKSGVFGVKNPLIV